MLILKSHTIIKMNFKQEPSVVQDNILKFSGRKCMDARKGGKGIAKNIVN